MAAQQEAANKIKQESNGRMEITIYPNSVLGGDTAMIAQALSGAMGMYNLPIDLLAPRNPVCGLPGVGFAFPDYAHVWAAMDGDFGNMLHAAALAYSRPLIPLQLTLNIFSDTVFRVSMRFLGRELAGFDRTNLAKPITSSHY